MECLQDDCRNSRSVAAQARSMLDLVMPLAGMLEQLG